MKLTSHLISRYSCEYLDSLWERRTDPTLPEQACRNSAGLKAILLRDKDAQQRFLAFCQGLKEADEYVRNL